MFFRRVSPHAFLRFFFFNDTATTEIYTLSLHDALPIYAHRFHRAVALAREGDATEDETELRSIEHADNPFPDAALARSEEHTSELQSPCNLVCRLLLEKKTQITDRPAADPRLSAQHPRP